MRHILSRKAAGADGKQADGPDMEMGRPLMENQGNENASASPTSEVPKVPDRSADDAPKNIVCASCGSKVGYLSAVCIVAFVLVLLATLGVKYLQGVARVAEDERLAVLGTFDDNHQSVCWDRIWLPPRVCSKFELVPTTEEVHGNPELRAKRFKYWVPACILTAGVGTFISALSASCVFCLRQQCEPKSGQHNGSSLNALDKKDAWLFSVGRAFYLYLAYVAIVFAIVCATYSVGALSSSTGLPWEAWWLFVLLNAIDALIQATAHAATMPINAKSPFVSVGTIAGTMSIPFISARVDLIKDMIFVALCAEGAATSNSVLPSVLLLLAENVFVFNLFRLWKDKSLRQDLRLQHFKILRPAKAGVAASDKDGADKGAQNAAAGGGTVAAGAATAAADASTAAGKEAPVSCMDKLWAMRDLASTHLQEFCVSQAVSFSSPLKQDAAFCEDLPQALLQVVYVIQHQSQADEAFGMAAGIFKYQPIGFLLVTGGIGILKFLFVLYVSWSIGGKGSVEDLMISLQGAFLERVRKAAAEALGDRLHENTSEVDERVAILDALSTAAVNERVPAYVRCAIVKALGRKRKTDEAVPNDLAADGIAAAAVNEDSPAKSQGRNAKTKAAAEKKSAAEAKTATANDKDPPAEKDLAAREEAVMALIFALQHTDVEVVLGACEALGGAVSECKSMTDQASGALVRTLLRRWDNPQIRQQSLKVFFEVATRDNSKTFGKLFADKQKFNETPEFLTEVLDGMFKSKISMKYFRKTLLTQRFHEDVLAVSSHQVVEMAKPALESDDETERTNAMKFLSRLSNKDPGNAALRQAIEEVIERATEVPEREIRKQAVQALEELFRRATRYDYLKNLVDFAQKAILSLCDKAIGGSADEGNEDEIRKFATEALRKLIKNKAIKKFLETALGDDPEGISRKLQTFEDEFHKAISDRDPNRKLEGLTKDYGDQVFENLIEAAIGDADEPLRERATRALRFLDKDQAFDKLLSAALLGAESNRAAAAKSLYMFDKDKAFTELIERAVNGRYDRQVVAEALCTFDKDKAVEQLVQEAVSAADKNRRQAAAETLRTVDTDKAVEQLVQEAVSAADKIRRKAAAETLRTVDTDKAVKKLVEAAMSYAVEKERKSAAEALRTVDKYKALKKLVKEAVSFSDENGRQAAAEALRIVDKYKAVDKLLDAAVSSTHKQGQKAAVEALRIVDKRKACEKLVNAAVKGVDEERRTFAAEHLRDDPDTHYKDKAIRRLGEILESPTASNGRNSSEVTEAMQINAAQALGKIGSEKARDRLKKAEGVSSESPPAVKTAARVALEAV